MWRTFSTLLVVLLFLGCGRKTQSSGEPWKEFSGSAALAHVQALVDLGPRPPDSEAIAKARTYIRQQLEQFGWRVREQKFAKETPRGKVTFVNLIARHGPRPKKEKRFLLCAHYDTKTFAAIRFVGANDGGSNSGALLEMARVLNRYPELASRIDLVFFDGEEAYDQFTETDGLYGSRHFARRLQQMKRTGRFRGGILWDMIGDRNLTITLPLDSPPEMAQHIFESAEALQTRDHFSYYTTDVLDDHTPLNTIGIPTIDLIDFDYPPWHTAEDTMDKLSARSLQTVGAVTAYYLANFAFR